jgi:hypothetical protein
MNNKSDDNLDKNSQEQTVHFVYDEKQKILGIDEYHFKHFKAHLTGFPSFAVKDRFFEAVKNKPELNFFGLEERQYNEITEREMNRWRFCNLLELMMTYIITIPLPLCVLLIFADAIVSFRSFLYDKILALVNPIVTNVIIYPTLNYFIISFFLIIFSRLLYRTLEYLIISRVNSPPLGAHEKSKKELQYPAACGGAVYCLKPFVLYKLLI